jgi:hypothetical protein
MSYTFDPGFGRGQVLGALWDHPIEKTDPLVTGASTVFTKKQFTDVNVKGGAILSNEVVTCVAVRNTTGAAVLPGTKQTVKGVEGVVDEYLPAAGCPDKEVYWLVVDGPTQQPLGTRVTLVNNGASVPRTVLVRGKDGTETEEPELIGDVDDADGTTDPDATAPVIP